MLYVAVGLTIMFGSLIFFGMRALAQATSLVFQERLSTALTIAVTVERDLMHVSGDVHAAEPRLVDLRGPALNAELHDLTSHLAMADSFAFFHASGVRVLDGTGTLMASDGPAFFTSLPGEVTDVPARVHISVGQVDTSGEPGFAVVATQTGTDPTGPTWVMVNLVAHNSSDAFVPSSSSRPGDPESDPLGSATPAELYHLEIFGPDGTIALSIGEEQHTQGVSAHFEAIRQLDPLHDPIVLRHDEPSDGLESDHVMAVVPMAESGLTLVLEQPIDVALALPNSLRRQLLVWSGVGFAAALAIAWFTTKAVARPTQQLTMAAKRMAQGDLESPIEVSASDEVATLVESLESMRRQTRAAYQAVEEANRELESRVRSRTAELGELLSKVITAQEDERYRLARELHDETAQTLGALAIILDRARDSADGAVSAHLGGAKQLVTQLLEETRRLIFDLRPMVLDDMGLVPAIRWYAETRLDPEGIAWTIDVDHPEVRLAPHLETALFRIAQEAMTNVAKHSAAGTTHISLSIDSDSARIVVADDGRGFEADDRLVRGNPGQHVGIAGMRERVTLLRGRMEVRSALGTGTTVEVEIPLADVAASVP